MHHGTPGRCTANSSSIWSAIAQPTTFREKPSMTVARQALADGSRFFHA
jgi:hypothetical protein